MKIGVFSVIEWGFLDQRPQVIAKKLSEWGHEVHYLEPFFRLKEWNDEFFHPWSEYEKNCWNSRNVFPGVKATTMLVMPSHKIIEGILHKNEFYKNKNLEYLKKLELDFAVVVDPFWGELLEEIGVPFFYDHVDDTHQMDAVLKDKWYSAQVFSEKNSMATFYIQPNIARRYKGLYIPNGIEPNQLKVENRPPVDFDAGCLSAISDWFDIDSVLNTEKKLLIIGPMDTGVREKYYDYKKHGGRNVNWIPRVSRAVGAQWLLRCKSAMVPFRDDHPVVDYVMPLKLVEYLYLGLPSVSYLNKGIEEEFGEVIEFYSSLNWRGLPDLDEAIDNAIECDFDKQYLKDFALKFTWDKVFAPMKGVVSHLEKVKSKSGNFSEAVQQYISEQVND